DRVPSVRSGRCRDGRGWRQRQAGAYMPPSGAGFARGVGAKRPRRFVEPFPRGQREGVAEKQRDGINRKRGWLHAVGNVELPVWKCLPHLEEREANQRRSLVATERIWLRSPIHVANRRGEAVEVVLRPFVIGEHEFLCRQAARLREVRRN